MKIILKNERPKSWNVYYSGLHWKHRQEEAERIHMLMFNHVQHYKPSVYRVDITIKAYFTTQPLDPDNIASKFYIDGLKGRVIFDDSYKWVRRVITESLQDKLNPRVEIEIEDIRKEEK